MPIIEVDGIGRVELGDEFLKLSPEQQDATVQEIAANIKNFRPRVGVEGKTEPTATEDGRPAGEKVAGLVENAAGGLVRGVAGLVGLPELVSNWGARGIQAATNYVAPKFGVTPPPQRDFSNSGLLPSSEDVIGWVEKYPLNGRPLPKPKTVAEEYARTIGEFAPGLVAPGGMAQNAARYVLAPAVASETAGQLTKGTEAEPIARVGGALAGGLAGAMVGRGSRTAQTIRNQMPEGVTPQMVDQAEALIVDAAQQGIPLSWPEALSQVAGRPVLTNTMRHLEAAPSSEARMSDFFAGRAPAVDAAARRNFDAVAPANQRPSEIGPAVGRAAEAEVNDMRGAINAASDPLYTAAAPQRIDAATMARVRAAPGWDEARAAVRNDPQLARYVGGLPDDSVGFLNEVKKYLDQAAENASAPVNVQRNMQRSAGYGQDAATVRGAATAASPEYGAALAVQTWGREQFLQPLLDGPIGKLAKSDITTKRAIDALFPANPLPNSADEIGQSVGRLAQRSPNVARDLVRAHMESTFNEASQALQSGANQMGGAKFRAALVGNPQQAANLEAAVRALPNGDQVWAGMNRFLDVLEATGTRQNIGSKTAYNAEFLKQSGTSGTVAEGAKAAANPLRGLQFLADRWERWTLGQNLDELARLFTDPRAANQFRAIARMPVNSPAALNVAARTGMLLESSTRARAEAQSVNHPR